MKAKKSVNNEKLSKIIAAVGLLFFSHDLSNDN